MKPKRQRKSRSRGLRTKTGCLTCRKRHKKCDERPVDSWTEPICGPCSVSNRDCVYGDATPKQQPAVPESGPSASTTHTVPILAAGPPPPPPLPQLRSTDGMSSVTSCPSGSPADAIPVDPALSATVPQPQGPPSFQPGGMPMGLASDTATTPFSATVSSEPISADLASTRWLDLLATDAAQADSTFSLSTNPASRPQHPQAHPASGSNPSDLGYSNRFADALETRRWQSDTDIELDDHESSLFRNFAERSASWELDLFDPHRHFSTFAVRLALRNRGLMRAILALSARHMALTTNQGSTSVEGNNAIQYYYETLHYVQTALTFNSYARSQELLATALTISTYEMLSESDSRGNWQRHLKGVFWIQRSQDVNGCSGGLRQAVWWAWLRQDIWAAFREKRRCFSFWKPVKSYDGLSQDELACRSVWLLSQAVNYAADCHHLERTAPNDLEVMRKRTKAGDELFGLLEQWKSFLSEGFRPLPSPKGDPNAPFQSVWIHPPHFAVAVQVNNWARILVALHRPPGMGLNGYLRTQKILSDAVDAICGIATELAGEGSQIMSAQCLYGAGLCVQNPVKRSAIIGMIEKCEARTGWPMGTWRDDLQAEWSVHDTDYQQSPL
ncbi:hypothetical protein MKZ38_006937 [Zalerion maritima]|uniref:Zn(2)-C6 fungal-type domain-containing protein n=1 Tax=Zalerion maritima TaxID=339359 RepID=A0AAD5WUD4_9PEZI|nr:hypothetical protein MKZ38_006937 [Zalerion maritima]